MTPERFTRLRTTLDRRQPDLTVLLDDVHKPHNLSAVLRTCDAVGVYEAHAVWQDTPLPILRHLSAGTGKWVPVRTHRGVAEACAHLRAGGMRILAADTTPEAVDFRSIDYSRPTAILLGAERIGVSGEALSASDGAIVIPMLGLGHSLNVSVAAATVLFEAQRQRLAGGLYRHSRLDPDRYRRTLFEWAYPDLARRYRRDRLPYPPLDEEGFIRWPAPRKDRLP
jgi:tRNA (guanosine-2'-O-)-methyltransferase